jgi:hypothetical protein
MAYFRPFSNVISIKTTSAARKKYLQYGGRPSMTSSCDVTASPLLEVFFWRRTGRFNGNNVRKRFFRADRNVPMHQFKPELRRQDLEGIHLPSFRFSWKLKKLCRVDFVVFESWQTAAKSQGKTITSSVVCHDSKTTKLTRQSFFIFRENLNEGK